MSACGRASNIGGVSHAVNLALHRLQPGDTAMAYVPTALPTYVRVKHLQSVPASCGSRRTSAAGANPRSRSGASRLSDTMSFLNDLSSVTVGCSVTRRVNQDSFSNLTSGLQTGSYGAEASTPLAGIVVKPLQNVSLYANYAEGLSQGIIVPSPDFVNQGSNSSSVQVETAGSRASRWIGAPSRRPQPCFRLPAPAWSRRRPTSGPMTANSKTAASN